MSDLIPDSCFLIALVDEKDKWHPQASAIQQALKGTQIKLVYLDCVINETGILHFALSIRVHPWPKC